MTSGAQRTQFGLVEDFWRELVAVDHLELADGSGTWSIGVPLEVSPDDR